MFLTSRRNKRNRDLGVYRLVRINANAHGARGVPPNNSLQSGQDLGAGGRRLNHDPPYPKDSATLNKEQLSSLSNDSDDYSNKLDKDAQVWKVYVNETDKHDTDLVNSWNDSTDVILIFAALFSAISTAFIIESTKLLQSDPTEASAQSLRAISQTLISIANNSRLPGLTGSLTDDVVEFIPSRPALVVNILWYLSLSLSLATSFIAILAKDWCHSFISGRSGPPYSQARRRQQKWAMIEKWRMSELLAVLPSLIHVALVLFSIGLCIHLWDIHSLVAVPVICVLAIAFGFYVASSIAATVLDFFPYPTIVSRLCRTGPMQWVYQQTLRLIIFVFQLARTSPYLLALCAYHFALRTLSALVPFSKRLYVGVTFVTVPLACSVLNPFAFFLALLVTPLYLLVLVLLSPFLILGVWSMKEDGYKSPNPFDSYRNSNYRRIKKAISGISFQFGWLPLGSTPIEILHSDNPRHDIVTSQSLSWLIKNCEVPQSVDVALQSIASVNKQFPRQPLEGCNAALEILSRLASSDLYRAENAHTALKLYSQALSALGLSSNTQQMDKLTTTVTIENIEITIWDIQAMAERILVGLITDGKFQPDTHNLEALRIGSTFAPHSLQLLRSRSDVRSLQFSSIISMLEKHLNHDGPYLHESTLFLLTNMAIVLGLILAGDSALAVRRICRRLVHKEHCSYSPQLKAALATSVLLQRWEMHKDAHRIEEFAEMGRRLSTLVDWQSASLKNSTMLHEVALLELLNFPPDRLTSGLELDPLTEEGYEPFNMKAYNEAPVDRLWISDPSRHSNNSEEYRNELPVTETVLPYLEAFHSVYSLIRPETMQPYVYVFVLECISLSSPPAPLQTQCGQLLDDLPIPELSRELDSLIWERDIKSNLDKATKSKDSVVQKFFAASQLWLLHVLHRTIDDGSEDRRGKQFVDLMTETWNASNGEIVATLGVYAYRLMESVCEYNNRPVPSNVNSGLQGVPQERRGLYAMLGRRPSPTEAQAQPDIHHGQTSGNHDTQGGDRPSSSAEGKARTTNSDAEELANTVNQANQTGASPSVAGPKRGERPDKGVIASGGSIVGVKGRKTIGDAYLIEGGARTEAEKKPAKL